MFPCSSSKIWPLQCWLWSQFSERYVTVVAAEQMLAQQQVWRRSQLAALSAASLTGYISYTGGIKNKLKNVFSLWNDLKMLWCWDKYLCQRVSIKNLESTARLWNSCRVSEIPQAASFYRQTCELWVFLSLLYKRQQVFSIINVHQAKKD